MLKFVGYFMSIINNIKKPEVNKQPPIEFTLTEVDAIIRALSTSHFQTKDIEALYGGIFKLQELRKRLEGDKS